MSQFNPYNQSVCYICKKPSTMRNGKIYTGCSCYSTNDKGAVDAGVIFQQSVVEQLVVQQPIFQQPIVEKPIKKEEWRCCMCYEDVRNSSKKYKKHENESIVYYEHENC